MHDALEALNQVLWGGVAGCAIYSAGYCIGRYAAVRELYDRPVVKR